MPAAVAKMSLPVGVLAIVHVRDAGVASTFPAASRARTSNVWLATARPEYACGDVHALHAAPSNRHSNAAPVSLALNANDAEVEVVVPDGPDESVVSGAAVSIVHERVAGVASVFPAASVARTAKVCDPSGSAE